MKPKDIFLRFVKLSLCLGLTYAVYRQIQQLPNQPIFPSVNLYSAVGLFAVFILMPINWLIEAKKWQITQKSTHQPNFHLSVKATFAGVTGAIFTPARVGEYFSRLFYIPHQHRKKATFLSIYASLAQTICTLVFGAVGLKIKVNQFVFESSYLPSILSILLPLSLLVVLLFLLPIQRLNRQWFGLEFLQKVTILGLSTLRYFIFVAQYLLLIHSFGIVIDLYQSAVNISSMFLVLLLSPLNGLLDLGVKSNVALLLFEPFENAALIMSVVFIIWCINNLIPAIIGYYYILQTKKMQT